MDFEGGKAMILRLPWTTRLVFLLLAATASDSYTLLHSPSRWTVASWKSLGNKLGKIRGDSSSPSSSSSLPRVGTLTADKRRGDGFHVLHSATAPSPPKVVEEEESVELLIDELGDLERQVKSKIDEAVKVSSLVILNWLFPSGSCEDDKAYVIIIII